METRHSATKRKVAKRDQENEALPQPGLTVQLVGSYVFKGIMDDELWRTHTKENFKAILDMESLVRKEAKLVLQPRRLFLYPIITSRDTLCSPILNHKVRFITHTYQSVALQTICYIYKLSSTAHQLICLEAGKNASPIINYMRRSAKTAIEVSAPTKGTCIKIEKIVSQKLSTEVGFDECDAANGLGVEASDKAMDKTVDKPADRTYDVDADKILEIKAQMSECSDTIEILTSDSDLSDPESDIEIVDVLPQIPFRNHKLENIDG